MAGQETSWPANAVAQGRERVALEQASSGIGRGMCFGSGRRH